MQRSYSKTKNIEIYTYLLQFETSEKALQNLDVLATHLKVHKNKIISCIAQAKKNPLIYKELVARGYKEYQFPTWFSRPEQEKEEPPKQIKTIENNSPQNQELTIARTQSYENTEPRVFMGMRSYDWGELQNLMPHGQPKTFYDLAIERELRERQELFAQEREATWISTWKRELSQAKDPATFFQILQKNQKWSNNFNSLSQNEKNIFFDTLFQQFHYKYQNKIAQENQRQFNELFPLWLYGQKMGKW